MRKGPRLPSSLPLWGLNQSRGFSAPCSSFTDYSQDEKALLGACDCTQSKWPGPARGHPGPPRALAARPGYATPMPWPRPIPGPPRALAPPPPPPRPLASSPPPALAARPSHATPMPWPNRGPAPPPSPSIPSLPCEPQYLAATWRSSCPLHGDPSGAEAHESLCLISENLHFSPPSRTKETAF